MGKGPNNRKGGKAQVSATSENAVNSVSSIVVSVDTPDNTALVAAVKAAIVVDPKVTKADDSFVYQGTKKGDYRLSGDKAARIERLKKWVSAENTHHTEKLSALATKVAAYEAKIEELKGLMDKERSIHASEIDEYRRLELLINGMESK